jgi:DNA (cytosine-5)-methyltransferase 1
MIRPGEIVVDNFAGGGGASTGMELGLQQHVDIAINHDPDAIDMHRVNHPETKHYCESVWDVDPVDACAGRPVGLAWFSPDCKHFSIAAGNKPVDKNIRGLAWVTLRWAALVPVRIIHLENVKEFRTWGPLVEVKPGKFKPDPERRGETFDAFIKCLSTGLETSHPAWPEIKETLGDDFPYERLERGLGYDVQHHLLSACDFGAPTIRKRLFLTARNDGLQIVYPTPTHNADGSAGLLPWRTAADIIDWGIEGNSIFGRKKALADNTMARIAKGLKRFVFDNPDPYVVNGSPFIARIGQTKFGGDNMQYDIDKPLNTITTKAELLLVNAFIVKHFTGVTGTSIKTPWPTITAIGTQNQIVTSHMIKFRGDNPGEQTDKPLHTISAGGFHHGQVKAFLIKYYGSEVGQSLSVPLHTVPTKDRFAKIEALVDVNGETYQLVDVTMRMLQPHELFAAQGFPDSYQFQFDSQGKKLSKAKQVARCGNAVCPPVAQALVMANLNVIPLQRAA